MHIVQRDTTWFGGADQTFARKVFRPAALRCDKMPWLLEVDSKTDRPASAKRMLWQYQIPASSAFFRIRL
jgi:hypothetical protein